VPCRTRRSQFQFEAPIWGPLSVSAGLRVEFAPSIQFRAQGVRLKDSMSRLLTCGSNCIAAALEQYALINDQRRPKGPRLRTGAASKPTFLRRLSLYTGHPH
jgi:hypothetical protein